MKLSIAGDMGRVRSMHWSPAAPRRSAERIAGKDNKETSRDGTRHMPAGRGSTRWSDHSLGSCRRGTNLSHLAKALVMHSERCVIDRPISMTHLLREDSHICLERRRRSDELGPKQAMSNAPMEPNLSVP